MHTHDVEIPADLRRWPVTRKKGKLRYIVVRGVLAWGLPMFVAMTFFVGRHNGRPLTPALVAVAFVVFTLLGGAGFGISMWLTSEWRYRSFLARKAREKRSNQAMKRIATRSEIHVS